MTELESANESLGTGENEEPQDEVVSGWADSIAKILKSGKPKKKKELILSRARKDYEVQNCCTSSFLIRSSKRHYIVTYFYPGKQV